MAIAVCPQTNWGRSRGLLAAEPGMVAGHMARMVSIGDVEPEPTGRFKLTVQGVREGRRRFADEFEGMQFAGHAECNRPGCSCLEFPRAVAVRLLR